MAKQSGGKNFAAPAQKYAGRVQIDQGPVQITRWSRPLTRADFDQPKGHEGNDLRPERPTHQTGTTPKTRKGSGYNR